MLKSSNQRAYESFMYGQRRQAEADRLRAAQQLSIMGQSGNSQTGSCKNLTPRTLLQFVLFMGFFIGGVTQSGVVSGTSEEPVTKIGIILYSLAGVVALFSCFYPSCRRAYRGTGTAHITASLPTTAAGVNERTALISEGTGGLPQANAASVNLPPATGAPPLASISAMQARRGITVDFGDGYDSDSSAEELFGSGNTAAPNGR